MVIHTKARVVLLNAFLVGSLLFGMPDNTSGAFGRGGRIFFVKLVGHSCQKLMKAVSGRTIT